jgi:hypothetical protein
MGVSMVITSINDHKLGDKPQKNYGYISYIHILSTEFSGTALFLRNLEMKYLKWKICRLFPKSLGNG